MTQIIAKYYVGDTLVAQNELAKTADLTQDVEKMKPQLHTPLSCGAGKNDNGDNNNTYLRR